MPPASNSLDHSGQDRVVGVAVRPPLAGPIEQRLARDDIDDLDEFDTAQVTRIDVLKLRKTVPFVKP